jgi:hypothetical protein
MFILFVVKLESTEEISIETIMGQGDEPDLNEMYHHIYQNETYKRAIKMWLPFLNKRGFLDTLLVDDNDKDS